MIIVSFSILRCFSLFWLAYFIIRILLSCLPVLLCNLPFIYDCFEDYFLTSGLFATGNYFGMVFFIYIFAAWAPQLFLEGGDMGLSSLRLDKLIAILFLHIALFLFGALILQVRVF